MVTVDSVVHFNQFPFWETTTNINEAATYMANRVALLDAHRQGRPIVLGETGWADAGAHIDANPANAPSMRKWLRDFVCLAQQYNWQYYWFIAYDSSWRRLNENDPNGVEGHFGIFDENGNLKPFFEGFSIDCTAPRVDINPFSDTFPNEPPAPTPLVTTDAPTRSPTAVPTKAPITSVFTAAPVMTTMTDAPTASPVVVMVATTDAPTQSPVVVDPDVSTLPPTKFPTAEQVLITNVPTDSPTFTSATASAQCQDHTECNALGLTGQCCPTIDDWTLYCCNRDSLQETSNDGPPSDQCDAHTECHALGLADACCPTPTGVYLDCCDVVPNECFVDGSCQVYSAQAYMAEQSAAVTLSGTMMVSWGMTTMVLLGVAGIWA